MTIDKGVHIVGIVGVPGNYGGFETLTDYLLDSPQLSSRGLIVYCESAVVEQQAGRYKGARLLPVKWRANGWQSIIHDSVGLWSASRSGGVILVLGTSATFWLPFLRVLFPNNRYLVNMAGLEWKRDKWGRIARALLKFNEASAAKYAHILIADNRALVEYVKDEYGRESSLIAYGGDQFRNVTSDFNVFKQHILPPSYDLAMARAQIDNNMELILHAYARSGLPLVFVSNWDSCDYGRQIRERYCAYHNIYLIGPIYDIAKVKALRERVRLYVHGHSAGGTNPVLVESMWAGLPVAALDVNFHRYTTHNQAFYFRSHLDLENLSRSISQVSLNSCGQALRKIAESEYSWQSIRSAYEKIILTDT